VELRLTPKGMRIIDRIGLKEALKRSAELGIIG